MCTAKYTLAIDSGMKNRPASFADCVVFGENNVNFVEKYLKKGMLIAITASMQQRKWIDQNGGNRYTHEYVVDTHSFLESKAAAEKHEEAHAAQAEEKKMEEYVNAIPDVDGEDMPFA